MAIPILRTRNKKGIREYFNNECNKWLEFTIDQQRRCFQLERDGIIQIKQIAVYGKNMIA